MREVGVLRIEVHWGAPEVGQCFNCYFDGVDTSIVFQVSKTVLYDDESLSNLSMYFCERCINEMIREMN